MVKRYSYIEDDMLSGYEVHLIDSDVGSGVLYHDYRKLRELCDEMNSALNHKCNICDKAPYRTAYPSKCPQMCITKNALNKYQQFVNEED